MPLWIVFLIVFGTSAVVLGALIPLRRRQLRARDGGSSWTAWCRVAATLTWRDRVRVVWANLTGRAVSEPRLAEFAVQRGTSMHEQIEKVGHRTRWIFRMVSVLPLAAAVLSFLEHHWLHGGFQVLMGVYFLFLSELRRSDGRRALRSAEANRELAEHG
ncbi:MAG TPA: hypothetical protein VGH89_15225 [Pseudonocardia sp.]|jgi:hypothetical protein